MSTVTEQLTNIKAILTGLQTKLISQVSNDILFSAIGESILYGCKVTEGSSSTDYDVLLNGQASGDELMLNPFGLDVPTRGFHYWNIASGKDGAFRAGDLTATVENPPTTGQARYDIAYIAVTSTGSVFLIATGTPSASVKTDFDTNGLDSSPYGDATISDPTIPVGGIPVARIYVEDVYTGIQDARIADIRPISNLNSLADQYGDIRSIPPVGTKTGAYVLQQADKGRYVQIGSGGSIEIPNNVFLEGDAVTLVNNTSGSITITCSIATSYISGSNSNAATISFASRGVCTVFFISGTVCFVNGSVT